MTFQEFVSKHCKGRLVSRPSFYSGRGPGDITNDILEMLYVGVLEEFDEEKGKVFLDFVAAQENMSATPFLIALHKTYYMNFESYQTSDTIIDIDKNEDGTFNDVSLFASTMALKMRGEGNEFMDRMMSFISKAHFLKKYGVESTTKFVDNVTGNIYNG